MRSLVNHARLAIVHVRRWGATHAPARRKPAGVLVPTGFHAGARAAPHDHLLSGRALTCLHCWLVYAALWATLRVSRTAAAAIALCKPEGKQAGH